MSMSDKAPLTDIFLWSSEHTIKPQTPSTQNAAVTTTKNDPPPLVLHQFQPGTKLGPIGHTISLWPIWPLLVLYGILAISLFPGLFLPQSSFMASGHILPSLASLANSSISPTPRSLSLFLGLGVSFCVLGGSGPSSQNQPFWATPFH
ncbi:hypothetical protein O181_053068 [Austropuccinia psidii MF-1]|uniref:Uncharacterized protein n=1 Tax=Austropuccinia psidii MF-1 TaxID=1389203 RepID=A0A9Q3HQ20_9BASI|nr:hypothetical protein [Austropuccinia psidii MF-1]